MIATLANLRALLAVAIVASLAIGLVNRDAPVEAPSNEDTEHSMTLRVSPMADEDRTLARQRAIEEARSGCLHGPMPLTGAIERLVAESSYP